MLYTVTVPYSIIYCDCPLQCYILWLYITVLYNVTVHYSVIYCHCPLQCYILWLSITFIYCVFPLHFYMLWLSIAVLYRLQQEERTRLREGVPYVKLYSITPKHVYPKLNGIGENGQWGLKLWQLLQLTDYQILIEIGRNMWFL